jgi:hypothetical protein
MIDLSRVRVRLICADERDAWERLIQTHHYLGLTVMVGRSLRYVAECDGVWLALLGWASAALKCAARDAWIGWSPTLQWQRLGLIANQPFSDFAGSASAASCLARARAEPAPVVG